MENPRRAGEGTRHSAQAVNNTLAEWQLCPDAPLCRRWSAVDEGAYCRLCWRDLYRDLAARARA